MTRERPASTQSGHVRLEVAAAWGSSRARDRRTRALARTGIGERGTRRSPGDKWLAS
jgi:hypothetical protein